MEGENLVVGIDIGTSKICAAAGFMQSDGSVNLSGFVEKTILPIDEVLKNGEIENASRTIEIIDEVLEQLADNLNINLEAVNVNISNPDIQGAIFKGKISKSGENKQIFQIDVDRLFDDIKLINKPLPGRSFLHMLPYDFFVNDVKASEKIVGKFGVQIGGEFYFLSTKTESLENLYYTIKNVKAKTEGLQKTPIHIDNVLLSSVADAMVLLDTTIDDKRNGVAIVNIGAEMTEISVYHKNSLRHFKALPIGGNAITNDLCKAFNIRFEEAESLKKIAGNIPAKSIGDTEVAVINRQEGIAPVEILLKNALTVTEWRLKEIAGLVKVELIKSGIENGLTNGIILTGGIASMSLCKDVFVEVCKTKNIRKAKFNKKIKFNSFEFLNKPKYSTVLGLLLPNYLDFDSRIDNRILGHSLINEQQAQVDTRNDTKKAAAKETNTGGKKSLFERMKTFIKDDNMNDGYNN